jgi:hypothetical protein
LAGFEKSWRVLKKIGQFGLNPTKQSSTNCSNNLSKKKKASKIKEYKECLL